jgi:SAM-dependent methyltransferase
LARGASKDIMEKRLFYTGLAKYYDRIYHFIDYREQARFITRVIKEFNGSGSKKLLDVACGTGTHADLLQRGGFDVTGLDISEDILREARKKNSNIRLVRGDMKELNLGERFGTIICFFISILYNRNEKELKQALSGFHSHLEKGGILIFDTVDKSIGINSKREEYRYEEKGLKIVFRPQWIYNKKDNVMDLEIDFTINEKEIHDHHVMGAFSFSELKGILEGIGFEVFILERNFKKIERYASGNKAIFVCRK